MIPKSFREVKAVIGAADSDACFGPVNFAQEVGKFNARQAESKASCDDKKQARVQAQTLLDSTGHIFFVQKMRFWQTSRRSLMCF